MLAHESEDLSFISHNLQKNLGASHSVGETDVRRTLRASWPPAQSVNSKFSEGPCLKKIIDSDRKSHPKLTSGLSHKCG